MARKVKDQEVTESVKVQLPAQVVSAKEAYAQARVSLNAAIAKNQEAMHKFRALGSDENKASYEATREAHKAALATIKKVRGSYHQLCIEFNVEA